MHPRHLWKIALRVLFLTIVLVGVVGAVPVRETKREALGLTVDGCVFSKLTVGSAFPCLTVNDTQGVHRGYAVLRPPRERTQVLVVPTAEISGIESPMLLRPNSPHYFDDAWQARSFVIEALGRDPGWDWIGLAVNSLPGRSQDRLHIHVDCVQPSVRASLAREGAAIRETWSPLSVELAGFRYWARRVGADALDATNPVESMVQGLPVSQESIADATLGMVGATFEDGSKGFFLLAGKPGSGTIVAEDLLDHHCRLKSSES